MPASRYNGHLRRFQYKKEFVFHHHFHTMHKRNARSSPRIFLNLLKFCIVSLYDEGHINGVNADVEQNAS